MRDTKSTPEREPATAVLMRRRAFLVAGAGVTLLGLTGCPGGEQDDDEDDDGGDDDD